MAGKSKYGKIEGEDAYIKIIEGLIEANKTLPEIAEILGVTYKTLKKWVNDKSKRIGATMDKRKDTLLEEHEKNLYHLAKGYYAVEEEGDIIDGELVPIRYRKIWVKGNTSAAIFILMNLSKGRTDGKIWEHVQKIRAEVTNIENPVLDALNNIILEQKKKNNE